MTLLLGAGLRNRAELAKRILADEATVVRVQDRLGTFRQQSLQERHFLSTGFQVIPEVRTFDAGTWRAPILGTVGPHVRGSVTAHGYVTSVTSVTSGYVTR